MSSYSMSSGEEAASPAFPSALCVLLVAIPDEDGLLSSNSSNDFKVCPVKLFPSWYATAINCCRDRGQQRILLRIKNSSGSRSFNVAGILGISIIRVISPKDTINGEVSFYEI